MCTYLCEQGTEEITRWINASLESFLCFSAGGGGRRQVEEDITAELESWKTESSKTKSRNEVSYAVTPFPQEGCQL